MAKFLRVCAPRLLFGLISVNLLQIIIAADLMSVDPGQNLTLLCNITDYSSHVFWFHLNSAGVRNIISTSRGNLDRTLQILYNEDESHFDVLNGSLSLEIFGVRETDLGFYYCGGGNIMKHFQHFQFGKPIRLNFTAACEELDKLPKPEGNGNCWITIEILWGVFSVPVLVIIIIVFVIFCRKKGNSASVSSCCRQATDLSEKEGNIDYASIRHKGKFTRSAKNNQTSDLDSVTYATVSPQPKRQ